jgi:hypothetical protein
MHNLNPSTNCCLESLSILPGGKKMSRKLTLLVSLIILASMLLGACAPAATPTTAPVPTKAAEPTTKAADPTKVPDATKPPEPTKAPPTAVPAASKYSEAPALAALVKDGKLPAVDKRLPEPVSRHSLAGSRRLRRQLAHGLEGPG